MQAYCVTCRKKVDVKSHEIVKTKHNHARVKGVCSACGKGVSTFASSGKKAPVETAPPEQTAPVQ